MQEQKNSIPDRISDAIHAERLHQVAEQIRAEGRSLSADDEQLVGAAERVCFAIRDQVLAEAQAVTAQLRRAGIDCVFEAEQSGLRAPQYHRFTIKLNTHDPTRSVELLRQVGYWHPLTTRTLVWESFWRNQSEMTLTRTNATSTRLDLTWPASADSATPWRPNTGFLLRHPGKVALAAISRCRRLLPSRSSAHFRPLGDYLSTPRSLILPLLSFAGIGTQDVLLDVGCGDGRVLIAAATSIGCKCIGLESQRSLCDLANADAKRRGVHNRVKIIHGNDDSAPLRQATAVYLFVPVRALSEYIPYLSERLRPGSRIVAHEQVALDETPQPDESVPLVAADAITVAHSWKVG